jgi:hypothetical protein
MNAAREPFGAYTYFAARQTVSSLDEVHELSFRSPASLGANLWISRREEYGVGRNRQDDEAAQIVGRDAAGLCYPWLSQERAVGKKKRLSLETA